MWSCVGLVVSVAVQPLASLGFWEIVLEHKHSACSGGLAGMGGEEEQLRDGVENEI